VQGSHGPRQPGHEHVVLGALYQSQYGLHELQSRIDVAGETVDERERAAGAAHPEVVAERFGHPHRLFREAPGQGDLAGVRRAARLEREGRRGDPPMAPQQPFDGSPQEWFGCIMAVPEEQDDSLESPIGIDDEDVSGTLCDPQGLDAELPGGAEVGVELPDGRQGEAQRAEPVVALLRGDRQGPLRRIELEVERTGRVGDQGDAGQQACLEPGPVVGRTPDGPPQEVDALRSVAVQVPQPGQRGSEAAAAFRVGRRQSPVESCAQVVVLELELGAPGIHVPLQLGFDRLREGKEVGEVAIAGGSDLAGLGQPVGGELPDGLEEPSVPRRGTPRR